MKVYYHSGDYDGIASREVFRHFYSDLKETDLIGWDYGDERHSIPEDDTVVVVDLNPFDVFGLDDVKAITKNIIWIDHHKSAIDKIGEIKNSYCIDGVAACRLAWQWCLMETSERFILPSKEDYVTRTVTEPYVIQLLGEYDIWDKRDENADLLQIGLKTTDQDEIHWGNLFEEHDINCVLPIFLERAEIAQKYRESIDEMMMQKSFIVEKWGIKFMTLNGRGNSLTFSTGESNTPNSEYDALMMFYYDGEKWTYSLYHANHNTTIDLSIYASKMGGGGHRGACGFQTIDLIDELK